MFYRKGIFIRLNLVCNTMIELPYYSAGYEKICVHCGDDENLVAKEGKYPICAKCVRNKKKTKNRRSGKAPKQSQKFSVVTSMVLCFMPLKMLYFHQEPILYTGLSFLRLMIFNSPIMIRKHKCGQRRGGGIYQNHLLGKTCLPFSDKKNLKKKKKSARTHVVSNFEGPETYNLFYLALVTVNILGSIPSTGVV